MEKDNKALIDIIEKLKIENDGLTKENTESSEYCEYLENIIQIFNSDISFIKDELCKRKDRAKTGSCFLQLIKVLDKYKGDKV